MGSKSSESYLGEVLVNIMIIMIHVQIVASVLVEVNVFLPESFCFWLSMQLSWLCDDSVSRNLRKLSKSDDSPYTNISILKVYDLSTFLGIEIS